MKVALVLVISGTLGVLLDRLVHYLRSWGWWWRRWTPVALYNEKDPGKIKPFYYRFWGVEKGEWQIGVRRAVKP